MVTSIPFSADEGDLLANQRMLDGFDIDGRHNHPVAQHGDMSAALEDFLGGVNDGFFEIVARGLAIRAADLAHVFYRDFESRSR